MWAIDNLPEMVKEIAKDENWSDEQKSTFVATANNILKDTGKEGEAIATGIKQARGKKENAKQMPKIFYCRHMEAGLAGYEDETILVETETMKSMNPSFAGKPIYVNHQEVNLQNLQEEADGYVIKSFYNENDGWLWAECLAVSDKAHDALAKGYSISNAYTPLGWGNGGTWHNCPYDREILGGEFDHLALVPNPRYENAKVFSKEEFAEYQNNLCFKMKQINNSKETEKKEGVLGMLKFFRNTKQEIKENELTDDSIVEVMGVEVKNSELKAFLNAKKNEAVDADDKHPRDESEKFKERGEVEVEKKENEDLMYEVDGEEVALTDLLNAYRSSKKAKKKNEEEKEKEEEDDKKENEDEEDDKKEKDKEKEDKKENGKNFYKLENAHFNAEVAPIDIGLDKLARGLERYGK